MKRTIPLLLFVFALGGVALLLINWGDSAPMDGVEAPSLSLQQTDESKDGLKALSEDPEALPDAPRRLEAGTGDSASRGMSGVETLSLDGLLALPLGSPPDHTLRVVAISIEYDEEQTFIEELHEIGETDPELMETRARAFREKIDSEPNEGRPYTTVEVNPDGSFSFEVTALADSVELRLKSRFLYLEEKVVEEIEEGRSYRLEPSLGACLSVRVSPPPGADADEKVGALERMSVELRGADSGGMMGMFGASEEREMVALGGGLFEARALPASLFWTTQIESPDYVDHRTNTIRLEPGEDRELSAILEMGARIKGVAVTDLGDPLEGATLSARISNDTQFWMAGADVREDESDEGGRFELRGIPAGQVKLSGSYKERVNPDPVDLELSDKEVREGFELIFSEGLSIEGVVLWPDGGPVEAAKVGLETGSNNESRWRGRAEQLWVTAGDDGAFKLRGLEAGTYRIRANHEVPGDEVADEEERATTSVSEGRWRGVAEEVHAGSSEVEVRLEEPELLKGRVVMSNGATFAAESEVEVRLVTVSSNESSVQSRHGNIYRTGEVEEDGSFQITGLYPAEYEVRLRSEELVQTNPEQRHVIPSGELVVTVSLGGRISGIVLDPSGTPASGCQVRARTGEATGWGGGGRSNRTRSDEQGVYMLEGLEPDTYELVAESDDWASNLPVKIHLEEGQTVEDEVLHLLEGGTIVGTVYGENGEPISGRSVMVSQGGFMGMGGNMGGEETTDASGRFIVEHITPGSYTVMTQPTMDELGEVFGDGEREPGFADFMSLIESVSVEVLDGETVEVELGAPPASPVIVAGRVSEADQPITTGSVLAVADGQGFMEGSETARIEGDGHYEMTLDEPGDYVFLIQGAGDGFGGFGVDFPVTIPDVERFNFDIEMPSAAIEGVVIGADGRTRDGVNVMLFPAKSSTGMGSVSSFRNEDTQEDGGFLFQRLRPGAYVLQAGGRNWNDEPTGGVNQIVELGEGELAKVRLELAEPGTIEGVVLGQDGSPIEGATVFFRSASGMVQASRQPVTSGSNGSFRHNGLAPGAVTVTARTSEGSTPESGVIQVRAGDISNVELVLENGTLLRCVCEDDNGDPLRASVSVLDEAGHEQVGLKTREQWMEVFTGGGEQRETVVGPLPPGKYTVLFTTDDDETARRVVRLTGRPERKVRVRIRD